MQTVTFLSGQQITIKKGDLHVVVKGIQGPSGPPGLNADAVFTWATQTFIPDEPQQEFILDLEPREGSVLVYLNGLLEQFWSLVGATVVLDDLVLAGDTVTVRYQQEI